MKQETGKPMTVLLDQAIRELAMRYQAESCLTEELDLSTVSEETWEEICEYRRALDGLDYQRCLDDLEEIKNGL